jgi:hypothetical protein
MPAANKIFDFNTDTQGWVFVPSNLGYWNNGSATPPNALAVEYTLPAGSGTQSGYISWQGTWEDLGVPPGSTVTQLQINSLKRETLVLGTGGYVTSGPLEFYQSGNPSLLGTILGGRTTYDVDSTWDSAGDTLKDVPAYIQSSNSPVELRIQSLSTLLAPGSDKSYYDDLNLSVNYNPTYPSGSADLVTNRAVLVATAMVTKPVYTGINNLMTKNAVLDDAAIMTPPRYTGSGNLTSDASFLSSYGVEYPRETGSGNLTIANTTINSSGLVSYRISDSGTPLFIRALPSGVSDNISTTSLFIWGKDSTNNTTPLTILGPQSISSTFPLVISGPMGSVEHLNLFLKTDPIIPVAASTDLFIYGSLTPSVNPIKAGSIPLYMGPSLPPTKALNLFISGIRYAAPVSETLNLFINAQPRVSKTTTLFLLNSQEVKQKFLRLFIKGLGKNPGYFPESENLNLFIEGIGSGNFILDAQMSTDLFIKGVNSLQFNTGYDNIIPMFLQTIESNTMSDNATLYISGTSPTSVNSTVTLVISKTSFINKISLYVHGF